MGGLVQERVVVGDGRGGEEGFALKRRGGRATGGRV